MNTPAVKVLRIFLSLMGITLYSFSLPLLTFAQTKEPDTTVEAMVESVIYDEQSHLYRMAVSFTNSESIKSVRVVMWNEKDGVQIHEQEYSRPGQRETFSFGTAGLIPGQDYSFRIFAYSGSGEFLVNSHGQSLIANHKVRYNPAVVRVTMGILSVAVEGTEFLLNLELSNPEPIKALSGWVVDEATNTQAPNSQFSFQKIDGTQFRVNFPSLPAGKYSIYLKALDENGQTLAESKYGSVAYRPPKQPSIFSRLALGLSRNTGILYSITAITLLLVGFLMVNSYKEKQRSATPFLQMGKRSKAAPEKTPSKREEPPIKPSQPDHHKAHLAAFGRPPAFLILQTAAGKSNSNHTRIPVDPIPFTIGRENCDLSIDDRKVSFRHARITWVPAAKSFYITDLKSTNGVFLNGKRIPAERQTVLDPHTVIKLSSTAELIFIIDEG